MIKPIVILTILGLMATIVARQEILIRNSVAKRAMESIYPMEWHRNSHVSQVWPYQRPLQSGDLIWGAGITSLGYSLVLCAFALEWVVRRQFA